MIYAVCPYCSGIEQVSPLTTHMYHAHGAIAYALTLVRSEKEARALVERWQRFSHPAHA